MNIVERLRKRNVPYGWLGLADEAADRIEVLEATLRCYVAAVKTHADHIEALEATLRELLELHESDHQTYNDAAIIDFIRAALAEGGDVGETQGR